MDSNKKLAKQLRSAASGKKFLAAVEAASKGLPFVDEAIRQAYQQAALRKGQTGEDMKGGIGFVVQFLTEQTEDQRKDDAAKYRAAAKQNNERDGELEIDDAAIVSFGDDPGAYVQAWVWVPKEEIE